MLHLMCVYIYKYIYIYQMLLSKATYSVFKLYMFYVNAP